jgi:hypothetical protein
MHLVTSPAAQAGVFVEDPRTPEEPRPQPGAPQVVTGLAAIDAVRTPAPAKVETGPGAGSLPNLSFSPSSRSLRTSVSSSSLNAVQPAPNSGWQLYNVIFTCIGPTPGVDANTYTAIFDTGAGQTLASSVFAEKAGLIVRPLEPHDRIAFQTASGEPLEVLGRTTVPMHFHLQLKLDHAKAGYASWLRFTELRDVLVVDLGPSPTRDLYVAWPDFEIDIPNGRAKTPLGHLALTVLNGATMLPTPRAPAGGKVSIEPVVVASPLAEELPYSRVDLAHLSVHLHRGGWRLGPAEGASSESASSSSSSSSAAHVAARPSESPGIQLAALTPVVPPAEPDLKELEEKIRARFPAKKRRTPQADRLVEVFLRRARVFGPIDPAECTKTVDFEVIGQPRPVSYRSKRKGPDEAYSTLRDWLDKGLAARVPWDTPAYGFVFLVPKPGGKFRVTINPAEVNRVTERIDPIGGLMPNMITEAQKIGLSPHVVQIDLKEAFLSLKLGEEAQRLSTFVTPEGKVRWLHGWFGWHSFPAVFQQLMMESVVLPTLDDVPGAQILAWLDDLVYGHADFEEFLRGIDLVLTRILAFGGRVSLEKSHFLPDVIDWCGVEVDLVHHQWRIARGRVQSLREIPVPENREDLVHVLGVLRYYYFGITDQHAQRARIARLAELDVPGSQLALRWTDEHTQILREACEAIANGDWILVFDPSREVFLSTDASGKHGFCVTAHQYNDDGVFRPILFYSRGWHSTQLDWTPQTKETYALLRAAYYFAPDYFPGARIVLVTDNRNLAADCESEDVRLRQWKEQVRSTGVDIRWIPGFFNAAADYGSRAVRAEPNTPLTEEEAALSRVIYLGYLGRAKAPLRLGYGSPNDPFTLIDDEPVVMEERVPSSALTSLPVFLAAIQDARTDRNLRAARRAAAAASTALAATSPPVAPPPPPTAEETAALARQGRRAAGGAADYAVLPEALLSPVVPGHLVIDPLLARIAQAQASAPDEVDAWRNASRGIYRVLHLADHVIHTIRGLAVVPADAHDIKAEILELAHERRLHYTGVHRTFEYVEKQMRVTWLGLREEIEEHISGCTHCAFGKPPGFENSKLGLSQPTSAPGVGHTWYIDMKTLGNSWYLLAVVEAISRMTRLRAIKSLKSSFVQEALVEIFDSFEGHRPFVLRSDGGPPFNSESFNLFCRDNRIKLVLGAPGHSEGQGKVETIFRPIAAALISAYGNNAAEYFRNPSTLRRLEQIINSTVVEPVHGSPAQIYFGTQPRTPDALLPEADSWSSVLSDAHLTTEEVNQAIFLYHDALDKRQRRALLASSMAQAISKGRRDASRVPPSFNRGDFFLVYVLNRPTRLSVHFTGPFVVTEVSRDGNLVYGRYFSSPAGLPPRGPFHVSRVVPFDARRFDPRVGTFMNLAEGLGLVEEVLEHRLGEDGSPEFFVSWFGTDKRSWTTLEGAGKDSRLVAYAAAHGLNNDARKIKPTVR